MNFLPQRLAVLGVAAILLTGACAPKPPPTPTVDIIGSVAAQLASEMMTQTAAAYSPTPPPATITPTPTETLTPEPTKDPNKKIITVVNHPECWFGPGPSYVMVSYINTPKKVELLGIGSVEGWYIVKNPYFGSPCWVSADHVKIDPDVDLTLFPIMTPPP